MMTKKGYLPDCYLYPEDFREGCKKFCKLYEECKEEYELDKEDIQED